MIPLDNIQTGLRTRALPALPAAGAVTNLEGDARAPDVAYWTEKFLPQGGVTRMNIVILHGLYKLYLYSPANTGRVAAQLADAVLARFTPLMSLPIVQTSDFDTLRVKGDNIPYREEGPELVTGFHLDIVTVPWYCVTLRAG